MTQNEDAAAAVSFVLLWASSGFAVKDISPPAQAAAVQRAAATAAAVTV